MLGYLAMMVDLDFQGRITFLKFIFFSRSAIIYFRFFEFLDLDYVKINTKIKPVACIQPEYILFKVSHYLFQIF